jgi:hypothetical protein
MRVALWVLAGVAVAACTPENGPLMRPGEDCLHCHGGSSGGGGEEEHATPWSLAGTVYGTANTASGAGIEGVDVQVTDANGFAFALHSNLVGNFYSAETIAFPLKVCVSRNGSTTCMEGAASSGACNSCHEPGGEPGRIVAP